MLLVPLVSAGLLVGVQGAVAAALGAAFSLLLALRTGWRRALLTLPFLLGALLVGGLTSGTTGWVVLLGGIGAAAGLLSGAGLLVPAALVGVVAATTPVLAGADPLVGQVIVAAAAAVYAIAVARALGIPPEVPGVEVPAAVVVPLAVVLGGIAALAAAVAAGSSDPHSYWLPATVFLLALPSPGVRLSEHARQRVVGTVVAVAAMVPVALLGLPGSARLALVVVALVLMLAFPEPLWVNAALSTVVIVLLLDPTGGGLEAGGSRIVDVALAAVLVVAGAAVVAWAAGRLPPLRRPHLRLPP